MVLSGQASVAEHGDGLRKFEKNRSANPARTALALRQEESACKV